MPSTAADTQSPLYKADEDGEVIGYAITNTDVDLQPKIGIGQGFRSLIEKPVGYILALLIILLIFFGFRAVSDAQGAPVNQRNLL